MEVIKDFCTAVDTYMEHAAKLNAIVEKYPPGKKYPSILVASIKEQFELHFDLLNAASDAIGDFVHGLESGKIQPTVKEAYKMVEFDHWIEKNPVPDIRKMMGS